MIYVDIGGKGPGLVPAEQALVPASDRGFLYGDGLFETVLARHGELPLLPLHLDRMAASARALAIPFDRGHSARAAAAVVDSLPGDGDCDYAVRITLTRGSNGARGYLAPPDPVPTLTVTAAEYRRSGGPMSAVTARFRTDENSPLAGHKSTSALDKVLARSEAARTGCDEAILLNRAGRVAEGSFTNIFMVRQGLWLTPPLTEGCLPGVMRSRVLALTGGIEWRIAPDDLFRCDGVYLTNAILGCVPLGALDGRSLPWGDPPPFAGRLWERRSAAK